MARRDVQIVVKAHPELRHLFAHLLNAIEELAAGRPESALYEIETIRGVVLFGGDQEMEDFCHDLHQEDPPQGRRDPGPDGPRPDRMTPSAIRPEDERPRPDHKPPHPSRRRVVDYR